jgi:UDP:flavonoid glycosyltransferase YjiC (YdhE family)
MRVLFTTIPGSGHFHPMVPLARALQGRGHEVTFAASPAFTPAVNGAGFTNIPTGPSWLENLADPVMQQIVRGELFIELTRMGMVEGVVRAARECEAEVIVRGGAEIGGLLAAAIEGLPVASHGAAANKGYWERMRPGVARAAAEHGLDGGDVTGERYHVLDVDRTPASFQPPGFVIGQGYVNIRPEVYDGGGDAPAWLAQRGDRPLVYVTLGTVFNRNLELFRLVAGALADEPVDVLVTVGRGLDLTAMGDLPSNVRVVDYLPQRPVMARASAVVCHGGYNTVIAALGAGVPLYVIPMGADQPYNAERVVAAGAGLSATPPVEADTPGPPLFTPPDPGEVREAVRALLADRAYREGARRLAAEIALLPEAEHAAERLESAVRTRQKVATPV